MTLASLDSSILDTTKKLLGFDKDYTHFDDDILAFINSALMNLDMIGVGPEQGIFVTDDKVTWNDLVQDAKGLQAVQQYVYYKTRLALDPPNTSYGIQAIQEQIKELEWRLNVQTDEKLLGAKDD